MKLFEVQATEYVVELRWPIETLLENSSVICIITGKISNACSET